MTRAQAAARINEGLHHACKKRQEELEQQRRSNAVQQAQADAQHEEALKLLATYISTRGAQQQGCILALQWSIRQISLSLSLYVLVLQEY